VIDREALFLDTSGLFAALDRRWDRHREAAAALEGAMREPRVLVTTDAVIGEFHGLALGRLGPRIALDAVDRLLASPRVRIEPTGIGELRDALDSLRARPDRRISLVDALSFGVMRAMGVTVALTLDGDFAAEGFAILP
jgi:predicted nucleic acid-binding protein